MTSAPVPPLPYAGPPVPAPEPAALRSLDARIRPPQVLLTVGVVLLVAVALAGPSLAGDAARIGVLLAALVAGCASAWAARARLHDTEEACAAAAAALALTCVAVGDAPLGTGPLPALVLAGILVSLRVLLPAPLSWPLAAWGALQVAALRSLALVPDGVPRTALLLTVALTGLGTVLVTRRTLARIALLTTVPWLVAGVVGGLLTAAATADGPARWLSAGLTVAAAAALLPVRLDPAVDSLLGPPRLVPVLAGTVAGGAVGAALSTGDPVSLPLAGWLGVLLASTAAAVLTGWRRGLLLPAASAAGITLVVLAVAQLVAATRWPALVLLLVLTALPAAGVAAVRPDERPDAVPAAGGCLAAAALLSVPAGLLSPGAAAAVLTGLFALTLAARPGMAADLRGPSGTVGAVCAGAALAVLAIDAAWAQLALHLAVQGALSCGWGAVLAGRRDDSPEEAAAWRTGGAELGAAGWTMAALAGTTVVEAWSLPAAAALLVAAGPRLLDGPSWPAWGPGLVVAAVPSTVAAVLLPGALRPVLVLLAAAAAMALGARTAVRAALLTGAATAVVLTAGLVVEALPLPLVAALVVGTGLLVLGARRELRPVAGFGERLAEMR
ncbi:hypothetical protein GCM10027451_47810 [Geodermatophilus aquaeductus]|uniref:Uncharacterized protein n=1 Tax=Geodermatophilus aquaeductus TaxID=1564161 RepID=A0A521FCU5_9ACTN|nr:hypothetical protein [Geodermatophilus aquaeductus]SMO94012.1 hypothetical protein SAMN06273567_10841 [Geodermatophilus aquaeductus]